MTPDQISALTALATLLKTVGSMPFGAILLFIILGPWICMWLSTRATDKRSQDQDKRVEALNSEFKEDLRDVVASQEKRFEMVAKEFQEHVDSMIRSQEKRFEAVVRMYENNVQVVKNYHDLAQDLTGIITLSTRTLEVMCQKVDNNHFCPIVRKEAGKS